VIAVARYQRVADAIRAHITEQALNPGDQLPTEPHLVREHGVSRLTIRHALDVLQAEGLIERFHGRGTFVRRPPRRMTYVSGCGAAEAESEDNARTETRVQPGTVSADASVAALMQVRPGTELAEYVYATLRDRHPYALARVYVPLDFAELLPPPSGRSPWGTEIRQSLSAAGLQLARVTERVTARTPTRDEASLLHLPAGATVLEIERASLDVRGRSPRGHVW
jgi:GntR family transcriptional regulator